MSRLRRLSLLAAGTAGLAALLLIPAADDAGRPAATLTVASDPVGVGAMTAAAGPADSPQPAAAPAAADAVWPVTTTTGTAGPVQPPPRTEVQAETPEATPKRRLWVGQSAVNVRAGPSAATARLFVLRPGDKVTASETSGGWTLIVAGNGESGWVSSRYLSEAPPSQRATPPEAQRAAETPRQARTGDSRDTIRVTFTPVSGRVTLRSRPSVFSSRLFVLQPGDRIAVIETRGRWVRVLLENGVSAWADGRDL